MKLPKWKWVEFSSLYAMMAMLNAIMAFLFFLATVQYIRQNGADGIPIGCMIVATMVANALFYYKAAKKAADDELDEIEGLKPWRRPLGPGPGD